MDANRQAKKYNCSLCHETFVWLTSHGENSIPRFVSTKISAWTPTSKSTIAPAITGQSVKRVLSWSILGPNSNTWTRPFHNPSSRARFNACKFSTAIQLMIGGFLFFVSLLLLLLLLLFVTTYYHVPFSFQECAMDRYKHMRYRWIMPRICSKKNWKIWVKFNFFFNGTTHKGMSLHNIPEPDLSVT